MNAAAPLAALALTLGACQRAPTESGPADSRIPEDTVADPWADACQPWEVEQPDAGLCWRRCAKGQVYTLAADGSWTCAGDADTLPQAMAALYCEEIGGGERPATHAEILALLGGCDAQAAAGEAGSCLACSERCGLDSNPDCAAMFGEDQQRYWTDLASEDGLEAIAVDFCTGRTSWRAVDDAVWVSTRCVRDLGP